MQIRALLDQKRPCFSFEFFPPKTEEATTQLLATVAELRALSPGYVSVTYGAGGSTRERTAALVSQIQQQLGIVTMAHLTCVGHTRAEVGQVLDRLAASGIKNVLALRGDPPKGQTTFVPVEGGFRYANELAEFVASHEAKFCVGGACYPEGHLESATLDEDVAHLKAKVDAGAQFLITQLFFSNAFYFDFVARARKAGITVPILPGIMPITNVEQIERFTRMCGATIPMRLLLELDQRRSDLDAVFELGVAYATRQCRELLDRGAPGIHFYTLNRSRATRRVLEALRGTV